MRKHSLYNPAHDSNFNFDQLQLYEGWCAFFHNEHTMNLMCVLEAIVRNVYGPNDTIPHRYLKGFQSWSDMKCTEISGPDSVIWNRGQSKKKRLHARALTIQPRP